MGPTVISTWFEQFENATGGIRGTVVSKSRGTLAPMGAARLLRRRPGGAPAKTVFGPVADKTLDTLAGADPIRFSVGRENGHIDPISTIAPAH